MVANKKRILHRLAIIRGHLAHVEKMVKEDSYCIDVLLQSLAVQKALKKVDQIILEKHLYGCVSSAIKKDNAKEKLDELMTIYKMAITE